MTYRIQGHIMLRADVLRHDGAPVLQITGTAPDVMAALAAVLERWDVVLDGVPLINLRLA